MSATRPVGVIQDRRFRGHQAPPGHPEAPARLEAVEAALAGRAERLMRLEPRPATDGEIERVHPRAHLVHLAEAVARSPAHLDPDTYVSPDSLDVARLAAGATVEAAGAVAEGAARAVFAAVRPPGHHAEARRAMGFCLLNNVAIAARALQRDEGMQKLLILDWDVHHGNGTQQVFEEDPWVLYLSTHQHPFYPGTGTAEEIGAGPGRGATVNVPLPAGSGDAEMLGAFRAILVPVATRFRPEMILVSSGFDAHESDPLASLRVSRRGFLEMTRIVRAIAERCCDGRLLFVLEGGYSSRGLREGTEAVIDALLETPAALPAEPPPPAPGSVLGRVLGGVARSHATTHPEIRPA